MMIFNDGRMKRSTLVLVAVVFLVVSLSGCTTLRRKFVRKSKTEDSKDRIIPVLQPEEYKPEVHSAGDRYRTNYTMLKGYYDDLWDVLGRNASDKREQFILSQIVVKMDSMADLLKVEKQSELKKLSAKVLTEMKELDKAQSMRRYDVMRSDLKSIETDVRRSFKPALVDQFLKP